MILTDRARKAGQKRAASKRRRFGADVDERVSAAIASGLPADPYTLSEKLAGVSYFAARRSLMRLGLWQARASQKI